MLKKLLKYDFRAIKAPFLIVLLISLCVSIVGGIALNGLIGIIESNFDLIIADEADIGLDLGIVILLLYILSLLAFMAICISSLVVFVFVWLRYYNSLYTDQGLLTFMLPVKRRTLINEKVLFGIICCAVLDFMVISEVSLMGSIGLFGHSQLNEKLSVVFTELSDIGSGSKVALTLQILFIFIITPCYSVVVPYACITIGSIIAKRHKVLASVGLYLGVSSFSSSILLLAAFYSAFTTSFAWFESETEPLAVIQTTGRIFNVTFIAAAAVYFVISIVAYYLIHYLNKKKLNLAG